MNTALHRQQTSRAQPCIDKHTSKAQPCIKTHQTTASCLLEGLDSLQSRLLPLSLVCKSRSQNQRCDSTLTKRKLPGSAILWPLATKSQIVCYKRTILSGKERSSAVLVLMQGKKMYSMYLGIYYIR